MKKIALSLGLLVLSLFFGACGLGQPAFKEIREREVLRVGVKVDVPDFGYIDPETGELQGLEIDLARLIAEDILGDKEAVRMIGVTAQTRGPMLDNGELDIVIATFTITEERKKVFHFSPPYFYDEIGFLVKQDSVLTGLGNMDGKIIGVVQSGTAHKALLAEAETRGTQLEYREYSSYPEVKAALVSGKIDAFAADKSILVGYADTSTMVLQEGFNPQEYGIAARLDDAEMAKYLDTFMEAIKKDGRLESILLRWERPIHDSTK